MSEEKKKTLDRVTQLIVHITYQIQQFDDLDVFQIVGALDSIKLSVQNNVTQKTIDHIAAQCMQIHQAKTKETGNKN